MHWQLINEAKHQTFYETGQSRWIKNMKVFNLSQWSWYEWVWTGRHDLSVWRRHIEILKVVSGTNFNLLMRHGTYSTTILQISIESSQIIFSWKSAGPMYLMSNKFISSMFDYIDMIWPNRRPYLNLAWPKLPSGMSHEKFGLFPEGPFIIYQRWVGWEINKSSFLWPP